MNLGNLSRYEVIAVWGAGISFKNWFRRQFHCDFLVDNDMDKVGKSFCGIGVISPEEFFSLSENKNVLLVISASRFYGEIEKQVRQAGFAGDIVTIEDMSLVHNSDRLSFAQFGIDRFCCDILRKAKFDISDMSFVEIGANHPIAGNQTYLLYLLGARGILVEPNPDLVEVLEKFRPEDMVANCGLGAEEGKLTFYRLDNSYRCSFDKATVDMNLKLGFRLRDTISIPVLSLSSLTKKYDISAQKTYLSLEVMGLEKEFFDKADVFSLGFPLIRVADHYRLFDEFDGGSEYVKIASFPRNVIFMNRKVYEKMVL